MSAADALVASDCEAPEDGGYQGGNGYRRHDEIR
jgi:hypothetical protein